MPLTRRRLPHITQPTKAVFLTWRLHDSLPAHRPFLSESLTSGQAFAVMDRLLDTSRSGPTYLRQPGIADTVVEATHYASEVLGFFALHAFVVMPNHAHLLITPAIPLARLTKSLKGITARRANALLCATGNTFWQDESYDHVVRDRREFERIQRYIEDNPVRAALVKDASEYRWSSGAGATWRSPADLEVCAGPPGPASS
jgi:REP element-mobilizing transposase RayT